MSLTNTLNMPDACGLPDFGLMDDRSSLCQDLTSSSTTFFDGTLLSPANISIGTRKTPGTSTGSDGHESSAYIRLWHQYRKCEQELVSLKMTHEKLVDSHNALMAVYIEAIKKPCADVRAPLPDQSSAQGGSPDREESGLEMLDSYSQSEYPNIHYWTKGEWIDFKNEEKNSSVQGSKAGPRGGTRCAKGTNVSMQYVEDLDGEPIDGRVAANIQEFARTLWADFYERSMAPPKWSEASMKVKNTYVHEMEKNWPVLRYCDNHWKAHAIATGNYPQWYKNYSARKLEKSDEPAQKRCKTVREPEDDKNAQPESEVKTNADGPMLQDVDEDWHVNSRTPLPVDQGNQEELRGGSSRPRARLLTLRDPLADVFTDSSATHYPVLNLGLAPPHPATQIVSGIAPLAPQVPTQMQGPGMAPPVSPLPPLTQMQGPGMAPPVAPIPHPIEQLPGPGVAPLAAPPSPPHMQIQGPGIAPLVAPSRSDTSAPLDPDLSTISSSTGARKRRYCHTAPLKPGTGVSAKNLCAVDWLKKHPEGRTGEFNKYWDQEIDPKERAAYEEKEAAEWAKIRSKKKKRSPPTRRAARK